MVSTRAQGRGAFCSPQGGPRARPCAPQCGVPLRRSVPCVLGRSSSGPDVLGSSLFLAVLEKPCSPSPLFQLSPSLSVPRPTTCGNWGTTNSGSCFACLSSTAAIHPACRRPHPRPELGSGPPFRTICNARTTSLIDAGKPVGVTDGIRKASEVGLAQTVQAEKAGSLAW